MGVLRGIENFARHRDIQSYRDCVDIFLAFLQTQIRSPMEIEGHVNDLEWSMTVENYLWQDWCHYHLPENENTPCVNAGIFAAVDGIRPGENTYKVGKRVPLSDLVAAPLPEDKAKGSDPASSEGQESEPDTDDPSLMEHTMERSRSRSPRPRVQREDEQPTRRGDNMDDYVQLRDQATREVEVALEQLVQMGQARLAGSLALHLLRRLSVPRKGMLENRCFAGAADRAREVCARYVNQHLALGPMRLSREWEATARFLEDGIAQAASLRTSKPLHSQPIHTSGRMMSASPRNPAPRENEGVGLVQMFATSSSGEASTRVQGEGGLSQVTQALDLRLSQTDTAARVRRALTMLHRLRRRYGADEGRARFPPMAEGLEAVLAAHACADGGDDTVSELDNSDGLFIDVWWGQVLALLPPPASGLEASLVTQVNSSVSAQRVESDDEDTARSHADTEEWLEKEELKSYMDDARRMQEYWDEQDREAEEASRAAQVAQQWDDWAMASEMESREDNKRRRLTVMVTSEGSANGQATHHIPLPEAGWAHVSFLIPPGTGDSVGPAGGGVTSMWPAGALSSSGEGQPTTQWVWLS